MSGSSNGRSWLSVDEVVDAYEAARALGDPADLAVFLPPPDHPEYLAILCELIRVDLEYSWQAGRPNRLDDYRGRFPELFQDRRWVQEIAFEEFRLRRQAGEDPSPLEYRRRFGADTLDWPSSFLDSLEGGPGEDASVDGEPEARVATVAPSRATSPRPRRPIGSTATLGEMTPRACRPNSPRVASRWGRPSCSWTSTDRTRTWRIAWRGP
jgi:hypothetical protein